MENARDSSIWRGLAVAFGDGLAFGVGMALSQRRREGMLPAEISAPSERFAELERRIAQLENAPARLDQKALETIVNVIEADLHQRDEQWARRLASAVESAGEAVRAEAAEKNAATRKEHADLLTALRKDVVADLHALEAQAIAFQQEVHEAIPRIVETRIEALLAARAAELEERLQEEVRQSAVRASGIAAKALDSAVERKLDLLREALASRDREIADLRRSLADSDQRTLDLLAAIGQACRAAAERTTPAPGASPGSRDGQPTGDAAALPASAESADTSPRFEFEPARTWSLPLVSSLLVASGCIACLHWL
jgi:NADH dehydrogenase/NADH:ubiquinone oxidoreductase subunit G